MTTPITRLEARVALTEAVVGAARHMRRVLDERDIHDERTNIRLYGDARRGLVDALDILDDFDGAEADE